MKKISINNKLIKTDDSINFQTHTTTTTIRSVSRSDLDLLSARIGLSIRQKLDSSRNTSQGTQNIKNQGISRIIRTIPVQRFCQF